MQQYTDYKLEIVLNLFFGILAILLLFCAALLSLFDLPPADVINAMQFAIIKDGYYPILTIFILFIPTLIPLMILKLFFIFLFNTFVVKKGEPQIPYVYKLRW